MTPVSFYSSAKRRVIALGYGPEIEWQATQDPRSIVESEFLREAAWVIYCSGFKESVVRRRFNYLSLCFCEWSSAEAITIAGDQCINLAMHSLANRRKHEAVISIAKKIFSLGFNDYWMQVLKDPVGEFQQLSYIGPITSLHLAKNLGFDLAKPDRHLVRLKDHLGYESVEQMCGFIAKKSGDSVRVVDLVLWRFLEQRQIEYA